MPDIFLSYNREDQARAKLFADAFERQGFKVWWDVGLRTGEAYDQVTETALRAAKAVVVLWSTKSVESRWVRAEATLADRNKTLLPCMIEPCERPIMFELTQTAELSHWQGDATDRVWTAFLDDVKRFVGREVSRSVEPMARPMMTTPLTAGPADRRPSLAIPPLKVATEADASFGEGLAEEIVIALTRYKYLVNVQRQASACAYVLEASLRRSGDRVRLSARLLDMRDDLHVWADGFEGALGDEFATQEQLANNLASHLATVIETSEMRKAAAGALDDLQSYQLMLRALHAVRGFSKDSLTEAANLLDRALQQDQNDPYVLALASLTQGLMINFGAATDVEKASRLAQDYVRRALRADGDDPQVLGWAAIGGANSGGDIATLDAMIDRALARNPAWYYLWHFSGYLKLCRGDPEKAIAHCQHSLSREPRSPDRWAVLHHIGMARVLLRDFDSAIAPLIESEDLLPSNSAATAGQVIAYFHLGRLAESKRAIERLALIDMPVSFEIYRNMEHRTFLVESFRQAQQ